MKLLKKLLGKKVEPEDSAADMENILSIAKDVESAVDGITSAIFTEFSAKLMSEDITYIVPAVWGATKDGDLSPTQLAIHEKILPIIQMAFCRLRLKDLTPSQDFAVGYILRSLIVSKIVYMIEASKRRIIEEDTQNMNIRLESVKPLGSA